MAYVVSATWTAQPGQEGVVLDAIEKFYNDNKNRREELASEIQRRKAMQLMLDNAKAK